MRHGSLFSGIGGFDLAASRTGWDNIFNCEKDPFCRKILQHYWPQTDNHEDIYQFNAAKYRGHVDVISGGFPCQPFSHAGKRRGKTDDRYLWPEARRVIIEARPQWIVLENVAGLFTILEPERLSQLEIKEIELFCQDSDQEANTTIISLQRRIIGSIISEIGSAGYILPQLEDGTPVVLCIPACAVNAPHRRDRIWFVAHAQHDADRPDKDRSGKPGNSGTAGKGWWSQTIFDQGCGTTPIYKAGPDSDSYGDGQQWGFGENEIVAGKGEQYAQCNLIPPGNDAAHALSQRCSQQEKIRELEGNGPGKQGAGDHWSAWPTQSPVCGRDDGLSHRLDGITFSKWRAASIKGYGNAIVPQIAGQLFATIDAVSKNVNNV